jgi:hypothetical protein
MFEQNFGGFPDPALVQLARSHVLEESDILNHPLGVLELAGNGHRVPRPLNKMMPNLFRVAWHAEPAGEGPPQGGTIDVVIWQTGTAPSAAPTQGPQERSLFLTDRCARIELSPSDIDSDGGRVRLGYGRPRTCSSRASGGKTLHQRVAERQ